MSFIKKVKKRTEEAAKEGTKIGVKACEEGVDLGKKCVDATKEGGKKTKEWANKDEEKDE